MLDLSSAKPAEAALHLIKTANEWHPLAIDPESEGGVQYSTAALRKAVQEAGKRGIISVSKAEEWSVAINFIAHKWAASGSLPTVTQLSKLAASPSVTKAAPAKQKMEGHWITITSHLGVKAHVFIDENGTVTKGPQHLIGANIAHLPPPPAFDVYHHDANTEHPTAAQQPGYDEHIPGYDGMQKPKSEEESKSAWHSLQSPQEVARTEQVVNPSLGNPMGLNDEAFNTFKANLAYYVGSTEAKPDTDIQSLKNAITAAKSPYDAIKTISDTASQWHQYGIESDDPSANGSIVASTVYQAAVAMYTQGKMPFGQVSALYDLANKITGLKQGAPAEPTAMPASTDPVAQQEDDEAISAEDEPEHKPFSPIEYTPGSDAAKTFDKLKKSIAKKWDELGAGTAGINAVNAAESAAELAIAMAKSAPHNAVNEVMGDLGVPYNEAVAAVVDEHLTNGLDSISGKNHIADDVMTATWALVNETGVTGTVPTKSSDLLHSIMFEKGELSGVTNDSHQVGKALTELIDHNGTMPDFSTMAPLTQVVYVAKQAESSGGELGGADLIDMALGKVNASPTTIKAYEQANHLVTQHVAITGDLPQTSGEAIETALQQSKSKSSASAAPTQPGEEHLESFAHNKDSAKAAGAAMMAFAETNSTALLPTFKSIVDTMNTLAKTPVEQVVFLAHTAPYWSPNIDDSTHAQTKAGCCHAVIKEALGDGSAEAPSKVQKMYHKLVSAMVKWAESNDMLPSSAELAEYISPETAAHHKSDLTGNTIDEALAVAGGEHEPHVPSEHTLHTVPIGDFEPHSAGNYISSTALIGDEQNGYNVHAFNGTASSSTQLKPEAHIWSVIPTTSGLHDTVASKLTQSDAVALAKILATKKVQSPSVIAAPKSIATPAAPAPTPPTPMSQGQVHTATPADIDAIAANMGPPTGLAAPTASSIWPSISNVTSALGDTQPAAWESASSKMWPMYWSPAMAPIEPLDDHGAAWQSTQHLDSVLNAMFKGQGSQDAVLKGHGMKNVGDLMIANNPELTDEQYAYTYNFFGHGSFYNGYKSQHGDKKALAYTAVRGIVAQWTVNNATVNDKNIAIQIISDRALGLHAWDAKPPWCNQQLWDNAMTTANNKSIAPVIAAYTRACHDYMQNWFKTAGPNGTPITHLVVFRGVYNSAKQSYKDACTQAEQLNQGSWLVDEVLQHTINPVSPATLDPKVVLGLKGDIPNKSNFGGSSQSSNPNQVIVMHVPVERVAGTMIAGFGALKESEIVIMGGGSIQSHVVAAGDTKVLSKYLKSLAEGKHFVAPKPQPVLEPPPPAHSGMPDWVADAMSAVPKAFQLTSQAQDQGMPWTKDIDVSKIVPLTNPQETGGSYGTTAYTGADGNKYIMKSNTASKLKGRVQPIIAEAAALKYMQILGLNTPGFTFHAGKEKGDGTVSATSLLQRMIEGAQPFSQLPGGGVTPELYAGLNTSQLAELLKNHAFDYLIGNSDAHRGNFLMTSNGFVVGIDKGQFGRFFPHHKLYGQFNYTTPQIVGNGVHFVKGTHIPTKGAPMGNVIWAPLFTAIKSGMIAPSKLVLAIDSLKMMIDAADNYGGVMDEELQAMADMDKKDQLIAPTKDPLPDGKTLIEEFTSHRNMLRGKLISLYNSLKPGLGDKLS